MRKRSTAPARVSRRQFLNTAASAPVAAALWQNGAPQEASVRKRSPRGQPLRRSCSSVSAARGRTTARSSRWSKARHRRTGTSSSASPTWSSRPNALPHTCWFRTASRPHDARPGSACGISTTAPTRLARPSPPGSAAQKCIRRVSRSRAKAMSSSARTRRDSASGTNAARSMDATSNTICSRCRWSTGEAWRGRTSATCAARSTTSPAGRKWITRASAATGIRWGRRTRGWWGRGNRG